MTNLQIKIGWLKLEDRVHERPGVNFKYSQIRYNELGYNQQRIGWFQSI